MRYVLLWLCALQLIATDELPWAAIPTAPISPTQVQLTLQTWYRLAALGVLPKTNGFGEFEALKTPDGIVIRRAGDYWQVSDAGIVRLGIEPLEGNAPDAAELASAEAISRGLIAAEPPLNPKTLTISINEKGWLLRLPGTSQCFNFSNEINGHQNVFMSRCGGCRGSFLRMKKQPLPTGSG